MAYSFLDRDMCRNLPREFYVTQHENPTCCVEDLIETGPPELFGQSKPFCLKVFSDKEIDLLNIYIYLSKEVLEFLFDSNLSSLSGYDEKARQLMIKYCAIKDQ